MLRSSLSPLVLSACFALSSCGQSDGDGEDSAAETSSAASEENAATPQPVELTDQLMEEYVALSQELKKAGESGALAVVARRGWTMERWYAVSGAVTQGMISSMNPAMQESQQTALKQYDQMIATLEEQVREAPADQRAAREEQLVQMKEQRASLAANQIQVSDLDRRNAEVLKRWTPRLQAAGNDE